MKDMPFSVGKMITDLSLIFFFLLSFPSYVMEGGNGTWEGLN